LGDFEMKKIILFYIVLFTGSIFAQPENFTHTPEKKVKYYQDFLSFKSDNNKTRLDVFIQVPYNAVQFIKTGKGFESAYTLTVSVYDENKKNLITEKVWNEKIVAMSFELTTSPENFNLSNRSFELTPGVYTIVTDLLDKDSKNEYNSENKVTVKDLNSLPSMSDVMLISKKTQVENNSKIIPNVSRIVVTDRDPLSTFYEIYSDTSGSFLVDYEVYDDKENTLYKLTKMVEVKKGSNQIFNNLDSLTLNIGKYLLKITLKDSASKVFDTSVKAFNSRWVGVPASLTDLDKAIDQLIYIANKEEIDFIEAGDSRLEKAKRFVAFWKNLDPNPADEYNPVFNEYFSRVAYANDNFSTYSLEGWRSDRGMVLIILGAPDNIDRHPFEYYSKPYEVWQYYNLNRQFMFIDYTGFGDYRLSPDTPLYGDLYRFRY
jgi:GWxTD domain-containing protein